MLDASRSGTSLVGAPSFAAAASATPQTPGSPRGTRVLSIGLQAEEQRPAPAVQTPLEARLEGMGRVFPITNPTFGIGNRPDVDVPIAHEAVATLHAQIVRHGDALYLRDAGSRTGTWVNDRMLSATHALMDGDRLRVGPAELVFRSSVLRRAAPEESLVTIAVPHLEVRSGQSLGLAFALRVESLLIGSAPGAHVELRDLSVGPQHARVRMVGEQALFTDLGSGRGSFVGFTPLAPGQEIALAEGAWIRVGIVDLVFTRRPMAVPAGALRPRARLRIDAGPGAGSFALRARSGARRQRPRSEPARPGARARAPRGRGPERPLPRARSLERRDVPQRLDARFGLRSARARRFPPARRSHHAPLRGGSVSYQQKLADRVESQVLACIGCNDCLLACPIAESRGVTIAELNHAVHLPTIHQPNVVQFLSSCTQCKQCVPACPADLNRAEMVLFNKLKVEDAIPNHELLLQTERSAVPSGFTLDGLAQGLVSLEIFRDAGATGLRRAIQKLTLRLLGPNEVLAREGEFYERLAVVLSGSLVQTSTGPRGELLYLVVLGPGSFFGEVGVLGDCPESYGAIAREASIVLEIPKLAVLRLMEQSPGFGDTMDLLYARRALSSHARSPGALGALPEAAIAELLTNAHLELVPAGQNLFTQADAPRDFFLVRAGFLRALQHDGVGDRVLTYFREGDLFGLSGLLAREPQHRYAAQAVGRTEVVRFPGASLGNLFARYPQVYAALSASAYEAERLARSSEVGVSPIGLDAHGGSVPPPAVAGGATAELTFAVLLGTGRRVARASVGGAPSVESECALGRSCAFRSGRSRRGGHREGTRGPRHRSKPLHGVRQLHRRVRATTRHESPPAPRPPGRTLHVSRGVPALRRPGVSPLQRERHRPASER